MKFQAELADDRHEIEIRHDGEKTFARIDDREYQVEVSEPEPGVFLIKNEGQIFEAAVSAPVAGGSTRVHIKDAEFEVRLIDPKRLRGSGSSDDHSHGLAEIRTAMPGKVVRLLKSQGDEVAKGEGVIVVEAMKMQNEMRSPKHGTVKEVRVAEGATVVAGDVLVTIE